FVLQEETANPPDRIETVDVASGEEKRVAFDERLPEVRSGRIVGSWPAASRVRKRHRGRLQEDHGCPGPSPDVLRVAHPSASDCGERWVRGDRLHPELRRDGRRCI